MSLEKKSLTQLRSIAQSMGIIPDFADDKAQLLQKIAEYTVDKTPEPIRPLIINVAGSLENALSKEGVLEALRPFEELGLRVKFPDDRTWEIECNNKRDSGSLSMSIWSIIQCVKEVVKP